MLPSLRRISTASFLLVGAVFVVALVSSDFSTCSHGLGCVASVNFAQAVDGSSPQLSSPSSLVALNEEVRVVSLGGLVILAAILLGLELAEPHFFKKVFARGLVR